MIYSDNNEDHSGLKYTKVESQQTAFIQSPSLSNKQQLFYANDIEQSVFRRYSDKKNSAINVVVDASYHCVSHHCKEDSDW